ncbi:hypothetical protein RAJCM14343_1177 [Rhodococcus aetherivorans]|uniref:Transposase n=1 Tax=Rhodococcus aetherivorans TaxID=191292 RepID=A0ABQ0YHA8_9NOCA|nr:hypothetical protein RAJCM14343_1177 [Rhodococcus aetherivorans]
MDRPPARVESAYGKGPNGIRARQRRLSIAASVPKTPTATAST